MKAKSIKGNTVEEIESALAKCFKENYSPTLALVFLPFFIEPTDLVMLFNKHKIALIGSSSYGSFSEAEYDKSEIVCMLFDINPDCFQIQLSDTTSYNTYEISCLIGKVGNKIFKNPAFVVISGGVNIDCDLVIKGIVDTAGPNVPLFGGSASTDFNIGKTFIFSNQNICYQGIIALIIDNDRINVTGLAIGGWEPIGAFHTITKSLGNIVYTINDMPALDLIAFYTGVNMEAVRNINNPIGYFTDNDKMFQLELHREGKSPIMRSPLLANFEEKYIVFGGSVPEGSKVIFTLLPGFETTDKLLYEFNDFNKINPKADALILFSCCGREFALGPWVDEELIKIGKIWNVPYAGFFTYGEIGPDKKGATDFHNLTCSLMILSEKNI